MKEPNPTISQEEFNVVNTLYKKFRMGKLSDDEKIYLSAEEKLLPKEVQDSLRKIDEMDVFKFQEGVDTEGASYKFFNSLNEFRFQNKVSGDSSIVVWLLI